MSSFSSVPSAGKLQHRSLSNPTSTAHSAPSPLQPSSSLSPPSVSSDISFHYSEVKRRVNETLQADHHHVQNPDWCTAFRSKDDIIRRLLPYHIYQYPGLDQQNDDELADSRELAKAKELHSKAEQLMHKFDDLTRKHREKRDLELDVFLLRKIVIDQRAARQEAETLKHSITNRTTSKFATSISNRPSSSSSRPSSSTTNSSNRSQTPSVNPTFPSVPSYPFMYFPNLATNTQTGSIPTTPSPSMQQMSQMSLMYPYMYYYGMNNLMANHLSSIDPTAGNTTNLSQNAAHGAALFAMMSNSTDPSKSNEASKRSSDDDDEVEEYEDDVSTND